MIYTLDNEPIVNEIKELIESIDSARDEVNIYCDLIKQIFLTGSNKN